MSTYSHISQEQIQSHIEGTSKPDLVLPLDKVRQWVKEPHLTEDPHTFKITAPKEEMATWAQEYMERKENVIRSTTKRAKKDLRENDTEAQWRKGVHSELQRLEDVLHEWQMWHALYRMADQGWLARPLWNVSTKTQVNTLAQCVQLEDGPLEGREWNPKYHGEPKSRTFKSMGVTSERDWKELARQVDQLGLLRVAVDAGPIPPPHNGEPANGQRFFWQYRYRTGRIDESGQFTDLRNVTQKRRAQNTDIHSLPPFNEQEANAVSSSPVSSEDDGEDSPSTLVRYKPEIHPGANAIVHAIALAKRQGEPVSDHVEGNSLSGRDEEARGVEEEASGTEDVVDSDAGADAVADGDAEGESEWTPIREHILEEYEDARVVHAQELADKAWDRGIPDPREEMGKQVDASCGVVKYLQNRGEQHGNRREVFIVDLHNGNVYMVPGIEGDAVWDDLVSHWQEHDPKEWSADTKDLLEHMGLTEEEIDDARERHAKVEELIDRHYEIGNLQYDEIVSGMRKGQGPPPAWDFLEGEEERLEEQEQEADESEPEYEYQSLTNTSEGDKLLSVRATWPDFHDHCEDADVELEEGMERVAGKQRSVIALLMHHRFTWEEAKHAEFPYKVLGGLLEKGMVEEPDDIEELVRPTPRIMPAYQWITEWHRDTATKWASILHESLTEYRTEQEEDKEVAAYA